MEQMPVDVLAMAAHEQPVSVLCRNAHVWCCHELTVRQRRSGVELTRADSAHVGGTARNFLAFP